MTEVNNKSRLAAIDLGSNSFHMLIAEQDEGGLRPLLRSGEKVQLAAGMEGGRLANDAIERGLGCLRQFAESLRKYAVQRIRVVATHALRRAENRLDFMAPAERTLGYPVEVIAGQEEARLVYLGVSQFQQEQTGPRLVIDIGGGSTELVVGQGQQPQLLNSLPMGCVSYLRYFPAGEINEANLQAAYQAACQQLQPVIEQYRHQWQHCIGCSGTLLAVEQVLIQQQLAEQGIQRSSLQGLQQLLRNFQHLDEVCFHGLRESRRQVFASGLAITQALFDSLNIENMTLSEAALREGVLIDLLAE